MTKQEILEAVLDLACENGLGRITMSQIAARVHLKKSSLYSHFRSKEDLIESMYEYFRSRTKQDRGLDMDYDALFEGRTLLEILTAAVNNYRTLSVGGDLGRFYRLILSERMYNPDAAMILAEETKRMILATRMLFYALSAKKIISFEDPDAAALSFALGVHAVMDYENDAALAGIRDADQAMSIYLREFVCVYETKMEG